LQLERGQGLEGRARLPAQLGLERGQVAALAQLAAVLVHHAEVHEQVGRQLLELEVVALDGQLGALAHGLEQHVHQAPWAKGAVAQNSATNSGSGTRRARALVQALEQGLTLSSSMPGTSHSQRSSLTWLST
jgi:hypothetical protein